MHGVECSCKKVADLTKDEWQGVCKLHHSAFDFPDQMIRAELKKRDYVYLYTDKKRHKIIGSVGIQWISQANNIILYAGNAVIHPSYKGHGLSSMVQLRAMIWTILKYPLRNIYCSAFILTPESFAYTQHTRQCWPNKQQKTPNSIQKIMLFTANKLLGKHYHIYKQNIIGDTLRNHNSATQNITIHTKCSRFVKEFTSLNPGYQRGEELLMLCQLSIFNLILLLGRKLKYAIL